MEPVVGLDVAKGKSVFQAFLRKNESYGRAESISHSEDGFKRFGNLIAELKNLTGSDPIVILEATGHYHREVVNFFTGVKINHIIINPLQSKRAKGAKLRKVKTDAIDAWNLAEMYYRGDVRPHRTWQETYTELQHATRQHEFVTSLYVQAKLNMRALLDQVFPQYENVFYDLYSVTALKVLQTCLQGNIENMEETILDTAGKSHSKSWINEKLACLRETLGVWEKRDKSLSQSAALEGMLALLLTLRMQLEQLEEQIAKLAANLSEVALLKSIPGIGDKLAATIISEIGDAKQFESAKQLVAYAGLDPGVHSSGTFTATNNRITKRGSKRLRRALYLAVQCSMRKGTENRIRNYYDKKKREGKPYKVAVIACANKLLHYIYAILTKGQPYSN